MSNTHIVVAFTVLASTTAEMNVQGNLTSIPDGDATPSLTDHTDFDAIPVAGGTAVRTFTIQNTGGATLILSGAPKVVVSGAQAADFAVNVQPASPVASGGTTTFQVTFAPTGVGLRSAVVSIDNNDSNENPYNFAIQGTGISLDISPTSTNVTSGAAAGLSIWVAGNVSWTATTNAAWLAVTDGNSGSGNGPVTFGVAANPGTLARTGGVVVAGYGMIRTCTVVQAGAAAAALGVNPANTNFTSATWSGRAIAVTGNVSWTATTNASWIAVTGGSPGSSNGTVAFSVAANPGTLARTGGVVVAGGGLSRTCAVTQAGAAAALGVNPGSTNFTSAAWSGRSIAVTGNVSWTAVTNAAWLAVTGGASGASNGTVTFSLATNAGISARTGGVVVAGGGVSRTCTVVQAGIPAQLIIELSGNLIFGNVVTGRTKTATMTIANLGNAALTVTSVSYPSGFSGAWSGSIAASNSTEVVVTFSPLAVTAYSGTITVDSDKTSGTSTISVSGNGDILRLVAQADASFGMMSNRFGFNINWISGRVVVVDACTNLNNPVWTPLQTNTLGAGPVYFGDSKWTNYIGRFYRIRAP